MDLSIIENKKTELENEISEKLMEITGLNHIEIKISIEDNSRFNRLIVESNDLENYMYPKMFKKLNLCNFGGGCSNDVYWLPIRFNYEHWSLGRNGCECATFWISEDGNLIEVKNEMKE